MSGEALQSCIPATHQISPSALLRPRRPIRHDHGKSPALVPALDRSRQRTSLIIRILKRAMMQALDEDTMPLRVVDWPAKTEQAPCRRLPQAIRPIPRPRRATARRCTSSIPEYDETTSASPAFAHGCSHSQTSSGASTPAWTRSSARHRDTSGAERCSSTSSSPPEASSSASSSRPSDGRPPPHRPLISHAYHSHHVILRKKNLRFAHESAHC